MKRLTELYINYPKITIWISVLITLVFLSQFPKITIDTDPENMLSEKERVRVYHNQVKETKKWQSPEKSADKIRFDALMKYTPEWYLDPYIAFIFQSQFYDKASIPGEKYYVHPIELTESIGGSRTIYENESGKATTRIGFGLRQKFFKVYDPLNDEIEGHTDRNLGLEQYSGPLNPPYLTVSIEDAQMD